ncbi:MAG: AraC family transcriptional regulator [Crocinitomicaceae bacterium]|nr:AraC family transcriptional regulator [Crocinitomicaceae bacterium]
MKALPFTIPKHDSALLLFQRDMEAVFYDRFHQHEAIQISFIVSGEGELLVGDRIRRYKPGDAFVIGSYLPHLFKSDNSFEIESEMVTVFFARTDLDRLLDFEELAQLENLLNEMDLGSALDSNQEEVGSLINQIEMASSLNRLSLFFSLLELISESKRSVLSSNLPRKLLSENEGMRMQAVMNFTLDSLSEQIKLDEVAELANMSTNAFCRYFKQRTNKSYFQFLIEIRIEQACTLLTNQVDLSISEVAELSGFQNLSNFNRRFKKEKGVPPSQFRRENAI